MCADSQHASADNPFAEIRSKLGKLSATFDVQVRELTRRDLLRDLMGITVGAPTHQDMILDFALTYAMERGNLAESGSIFVTLPVGMKKSLRLLFKNALTAEGTVQRLMTADEFETFEEGEGFAGYVLSSGESICSNDPPADCRYKSFAKLPQLKSLICVPVKSGNDVLAVLSIHNRLAERAFTEYDLAFVQDLAGASALCIRAYHNDLTMLPSRPLMDELLRREIDWARRQNRPLSLAYIDVDDFTRVNREYTHDGGDQLIKEFAGLMREHAGHNTILCHRHGDEFAIIFRDHDAYQARATGERIRAAVEEKTFSVTLPEREVQSAKITASVGITQWREPRDYRGLVARADEANKAAKEEGRNRIKFLD